MRKFFFARHGQTDWNLEDRIQGQTPSVPLNKTGLQQAEDLGRALVHKPIDLIISSTLDRAAKTAQIIAQHTKLQIIYDERLIEQGWGNTEGKTLEEIFDESPEMFFPGTDRNNLSFSRFQPPGGETHEAIAIRATNALFDLLAKHQNKNLLLVSHGAWLRALVNRLTGINRGFSNAQPYKAFEVYEGWQIEEIGER